MTSVVIWTIVVLAGLGLLLALLLYFVAQKFKTSEDSRVADVEAVLPGANCGGCGYAGCHDFASSAVAAPNLKAHYCPVGGDAVMQKVAAILGYEAQKKAPQVSVLLCNGTCEARPRLNTFDGVQTCAVKANLYAGDTACAYGCLGCGDCVRACKFGALSMNAATGLPQVDENKCTACAACAKACPRHIIELRDKGPRGVRMVVKCRNKDKGPVAKKECANACIGCGICFKTCAHGAIVFENNLAYIDYTKCKLCRECEAVCPTGSIHGINFPKELDKAAVKARIAQRKEESK